MSRSKPVRGCLKFRNQISQLLAPSPSGTVTPRPVRPHLWPCLLSLGPRLMRPVASLTLHSVTALASHTQHGSRGIQHPLPESLKTTRCYSQRPLTRYLWLFPSAYPGQDIPPFPRLPADALHVTCHLPKLHLLPTSLPKTRNSKKRLLSPLLY